MGDKDMKIGILGGSFDPIHHGHLIIAEYARTGLNLDIVLFIPSGIHPLKNNDNISDPLHRIRAIKYAIESNENFSLSTYEIDRQATSYTIDTVKHLKDLYKNDELYFIIGTDILFEIERWKDFKDLFKYTKFLLFRRPGFEDKEVVEKLKDLKEDYNIDFEELASPLLDISSTEIRDRMKKGLSIKYLVPERVEEYLESSNLIGGRDYE